MTSPNRNPNGSSRTPEEAEPTLGRGGKEIIKRTMQKTDKSLGGRKNEVASTQVDLSAPIEATRRPSGLPTRQTAQEVRQELVEKFRGVGEASADASNSNLHNNNVLSPYPSLEEGQGTKLSDGENNRGPDSTEPAVLRNGRTLLNAHVSAYLLNSLKELGVSLALRQQLAAELKAMSDSSSATPTDPETLSFAEALAEMTLEDREKALKERYPQTEERKTWTETRSRKPTPDEFLAWLDASFPDRQDIGIVLSDFRFLDKAAYDKVINWLRGDSGIAKATIDSFGLPSKVTKYDAVRDASAPTSLAEVVSRSERGEGSFKELHRDFTRARYHQPKP